MLPPVTIAPTLHLLSPHLSLAQVACLEHAAELSHQVLLGGVAHADALLARKLRQSVGLHGATETAAATATSRQTRIHTQHDDASWLGYMGGDCYT
jgi:hypothetical protein